MASCVVAGAGGSTEGRLLVTLLANGEDVRAAGATPLWHWCDWSLGELLHTEATVAAGPGCGAKATPRT
jgi:hypothetical protein